MILIGIQHPRFFVASKYREGRSEDPVALKTPLGWAVLGRNTPSLHISALTHQAPTSSLERQPFEIEQVSAYESVHMDATEKDSLPDSIKKTTRDRLKLKALSYPSRTLQRTCSNTQKLEEKSYVKATEKYPTTPVVVNRRTHTPKHRRMHVADVCNQPSNTNLLKGPGYLTHTVCCSF